VLSERTILPERNLDVLRAFAVLGVLANHLDLAVGDHSVTGNWLGYWLGRAGVLAFFVHTSLVLMASIERQGTGEHWAGAFYIRRAFRIYPLAIVTIVAVLAAQYGPEVPVFGVVNAFTWPSAGAIAANLGLVQNLFGVTSVQAVLWTLPIEVQMYLVLPLCYLAARRGITPVLMLLLIGMAGGFLYTADMIRGLWRVDTLAFVPCFMAGVLAYAILRRRPRAIVPGWAWLFFLVGNCALFWVIGVLGKGGEGFVWNRHHWLQWGYCLVIGLAIPAVRQIPPGLLARGAKTIAKYSYGIYLLHMPALALGLVTLRHAPPVVQWVVAALLIVVLPVLAFHLIEEPGIKLGVRLAGAWSHARRTRLVDAARDPVP
jgi:peptidoglycan/LPS O-acetylase OafA/YrhL